MSNMVFKLKTFFVLLVLSCIFLIYISVGFNKANQFRKNIFSISKEFTQLDLYVYVEASNHVNSGKNITVIPNQDTLLNKKEDYEILIDIIGEGICWFVTGMQMLSSLNNLKHLIIQAKHKLKDTKNKEEYFIHYFVRFFDLFYSNKLIRTRNISELYRNLFLTLRFGYLESVLNNNAGDMTVFLGHVLERLNIELSPGTIDDIFRPEYSFVKEVYLKETSQPSKYKYIRNDNLGFILGNIRVFLVTVKESDITNGNEQNGILSKFKEHLENLINGEGIKTLTPILCFELSLNDNSHQKNTYYIEDIKELRIKKYKNSTKERIFRLKSYAIRKLGHVFACNLASNEKFYDTDIELLDVNEEFELKECNINDVKDLLDVVFLFEEDIQ